MSNFDKDMISIHKNDIPDYLKCSELYAEIEKGYFIDSNNIIKVPNNCLKTTTEINSIDDFFKLRKTIKYWKVKNLFFDKFFDFIEQNRIKGLDYSSLLFTDYNHNDFPFFREIQYLVAHNEISIKDLIKNNLVNLLRYFHLKGYKLESDSCDLAAQNGSLNCLIYVRENGCVWDESTCSEAAELGHLNCLKYAHENGCKWDSETVLFSAIYGKLECLIYSIENGCNIPKNILKEIIDCDGENSYECFECFKYLHSKKELELEEKMIKICVLKNSINILKYLIENNCPKSSNTLYGKFLIKEDVECENNFYGKFTVKKNIDCINYIYEIDPVNGLGLTKYMKMDNKRSLSLKKEELQNIHEIENFLINNDHVKSDLSNIGFYETIKMPIKEDVN